MTIIHNDYCLKLQSQSAEYLKTWPNRCPKCFGWGYVIGGGECVEVWGAMTHLPDTQEPCEDCVCNCKCPRCGGEIEWDDERDVIFPCVQCGYEYGVTDGQPEVECECWMGATEREL